jgi:hypothetical protein
VILERQDEVVRIPDQDVSALQAWFDHRCDPFIQHIVQVDVGEQWRDYASYNLAKLPFELGFRIQRERLKPGYGDGFHGAPLVVWPASGDRPLGNGGADVPARQKPTAVIDPGEP